MSSFLFILGLMSSFLSAFPHPLLPSVSLIRLHFCLSSYVFLTAFPSVFHTFFLLFFSSCCHLSYSSLFFLLPFNQFVFFSYVSLLSLFLSSVSPHIPDPNSCLPFFCSAFLLLCLSSALPFFCSASLLLCLSSALPFFCSAFLSALPPLCLSSYLPCFLSAFLSPTNSFRR